MMKMGAAMSLSERIIAKRQGKVNVDETIRVSLNNERDEVPIPSTYPPCIPDRCNPKLECFLFDGIDSVKYSFLNGMVFPICHGGINLSYNLTTSYTIPYRMIVIYGTPKNFSGLSSNDINNDSHRMNKLFRYQSIFNEVFLDLQLQQCIGITTMLYLRRLKALQNSEEIANIIFKKKYPHVTDELAIAVGRKTEDLAKSYVGTPVNQYYAFFNTYFSNNENYHDSFSGLFLPVYCRGEEWVSSNYNPIIFDKEPIKIINTCQRVSTLPEKIINMPTFDLTSMRDLKKVKNMNTDNLLLIIKMLIARKTAFTSCNSKTKIDPAPDSTSISSTATLLDISLIETDLPIENEDFELNGLHLDNNNVKIARITSEDVSILMYMLWFISNGKTPEVERIKYYMKNMYFYYYYLIQKVALPQHTLSDHELELLHGDATLLPLAAITAYNTIINNYIHERANFYNITFLTVNHICRPPADSTKKLELVEKGIFTQECESEFNSICATGELPDYSPITVNPTSDAPMLSRENRIVVEIAPYAAAAASPPDAVAATAYVAASPDIAYANGVASNAASSAYEHVEASVVARAADIAVSAAADAHNAADAHAANAGSIASAANAAAHAYSAVASPAAAHAVASDAASRATAPDAASRAAASDAASRAAASDAAIASTNANESLLTRFMIFMTNFNYKEGAQEKTILDMVLNSLRGPLQRLPRSSPTQRLPEEFYFDNLPTNKILTEIAYKKEEECHPMRIRDLGIRDEYGTESADTGEDMYLLFMKEQQENVLDLINGKKSETNLITKILQKKAAIKEEAAIQRADDINTNERRKRDITITDGDPVSDRRIVKGKRLPLTFGGKNIHKKITRRRTRKIMTKRQTQRKRKRQTHRKRKRTIRRK